MPAVTLSITDGVATIELNRPEALNAWNGPLGDELLAAVRRVGDDAAVRAVLVRATGRAFSVGADLRDLAGREMTAEGSFDLRRILVQSYHPIITGLRRMGKPVVACVQGAAVGIGLSLALACDLVVAGESATFLLGFARIGLVPDGGASLLVSARVGFSRAAQLALLSERLDARSALDWGLINRVVADDALTADTQALGQQLASGPTRAFAGAKRELNAAMYAGLDEQLALEADVQQEMAAGDDFAEGVAAFVQKREPRFGGS
jgi:2-(1,2-epoxy-1,2-dihydrophenyl)acetyl-CoA isomerase